MCGLGANQPARALRNVGKGHPAHVIRLNGEHLREIARLFAGQLHIDRAQRRNSR
jgi:hypothetical protein